MFVKFVAFTGFPTLHWP